MMEVKFWLPFPPSVNEMFANVPGKGRVKTTAYKKWQGEASRYLMISRPKPFEGQVCVSIDLDDSRRGDADNRYKAVSDLLVAHRVIVDDSKKYVRRVSIGWEPGVEAGCIVTIKEL